MCGSIFWLVGARCKREQPILQDRRPEQHSVPRARLSSGTKKLLGGMQLLVRTFFGHFPAGLLHQVKAR